MSEKRKKSWSYGRLTTDQPDDNMSQALNLFFAKDKVTWARNCGPEPECGDIKLTDFIRLAAKTMNIPNLELALPLNDSDLDCLMADMVADGPEEPEGLLAIIHTAGWAFAELRERLKAYEDTGLTPEDVSALEAERDAAVADLESLMKCSDGFEACLLCKKKKICKEMLDKTAVLGSDEILICAPKWHGPQEVAV